MLGTALVKRGASQIGTVSVPTSGSPSSNALELTLQSTKIKKSFELLRFDASKSLFVIAACYLFRQYMATTSQNRRTIQHS